MTSAPNHLIASGLLYEGSDFTSWRRALRQVLKVHYPRIEILCATNNHRKHLIKGVDPRDYSDITAIIWWQVSPHVSSRVPEQCRKTPHRLLNALAATAQPFRAMDLPADIRRRIYDFVSASEPSEVWVTLMRRKTPILRYAKEHVLPFEHVKEPVHEPPLASTNRQIRTEFLLVYYQTITFGFIFSDRIQSRRAQLKCENDLELSEEYPGRRPLPTIAERTDAINTWASRLEPGIVKSLRRISMQLPLFGICSKLGSEDMLHFNLTSRDGKLELSVEDHTWLDPGSQQLLRDHTSHINKLAQSLKADGHALIMVLTSRPDIWDQLELVDD